LYRVPNILDQTGRRGEKRREKKGGGEGDGKLPIEKRIGFKQVQTENHSKSFPT